MEINTESPEQHRRKRLEEDAAQLFISGFNYVEVVQTLISNGVNGPDAREIAGKVEIECRKEIRSSHLKRAGLGLLVAFIAGAFTYFNWLGATQGRGGGAYLSMQSAALGGMIFFAYNMYRWIRSFIAGS